MKVRNAEALSVHLLFLVFPLLLPPALWKSWKSRDRDTLFLGAWMGIFFGGAIVFFFAGSARYLLPLAAPLAILVSRLRPVYLACGFAAQLAISLSLATVNYQHWDAYRQFARVLAPEAQKRRVWVNAEWGLRFYLEQEGARPVPEHQQIPAGDMMVESELAYPVPYRHGGSVLVPVARQEIRPRLPFRLIGIDTRSGYSTTEKGLLPFGFSSGLIDRVRADVLQERIPTREDLPMNAPDANDQILSGIYSLEQNQWRWTARQGSLLLKAPDAPTPVHISFYIPDPAPARQITLTLDGVTILQKTAEKPGSYQWETAPLQPKSSTAVLGITVDKTFSSPGDDRQLGVILTEAGFRK